MKRTAFVITLLIAAASANAAPWTYHGTLNDGGKPANGPYDLRLTLINDAGTASVGQPITLYNVPVKDGNFSAEVEFGVDLSRAPPLKLKTEVAQNGDGFSSLGEPTRFDPKATLAGICWDTTGNVLAAGEFLGSTNNEPLELRSNNVKVMRITGGLTQGGVNIESGATANLVTNGNVAQTIAGGGLAGQSCGYSGNSSCSNTTTEDAATIGGGIANIASGRYTVVAGGATNQASGRFSTVSGGERNTALGGSSVVGGGDFNVASGAYSTASGGASNCAGGNYSWAGGFGVKIRPGNEPTDGTCAANSGDADGDNGTFAWADDQSGSFVSTGPRQFLVRAQGGMAINTNSPTAGAALTINGNAAISDTGSISFGSASRQILNLYGVDFGIGIQTGTLYSRSNTNFAWFQGGVHDGGTFNPGTGGTVRMTLDGLGQLRTTTGTIATVSDARLKKNVSDYTGALSQIAALRPVYFEYKDTTKAFEAPGQHLGFIAQEVEKVFPQWVSTDEQGYLSLSLRGFEAVAVRAMQELEAENASLRASLAAQNARLDALEKALER